MKPKYKFGWRFKYEEFPNIKACHEEYIKLVDKSYEIEALVEEGKCSEKDSDKIFVELNNFEENVYAKAMFEEFHGKNIMLKNSLNKKNISFDELYDVESFEQLSKGQKVNLSRLCEVNRGWTLPVEYYENPKKARKEERNL